VNRLTFELTCDKEHHALELRHNFAQTFQVQITEIVDKVCSTYIPENESFQIDCIEIDLGQFNPSSLQTRFSEIFRYHFEKELIEKISILPHVRSNSSKAFTYFEMFCYFMENGTLPWWAATLEENWEEWSASVFEAEEDRIKLFFENAIANPAIWKRASFQLNKELKYKVFSFFSKLSDVKKQIEDLLNHLIKVNILHIDTNVSPFNEALEEFIITNAPVILHRNEIPGPSLELLKEVLFIFFKDDTTRSMAIPIIEEYYSPNITILQPFVLQNPTQGVPMVEELFPKKETELEDRLVVRHAGLVLLIPFLKTLLVNMELLQGNQWKNQESVYKGIHLLKFLCTGLEKVPEYNLTLEKVVCGFSVTEPIPINVPLDDKEKKECEMLLQSVIEHWKALKNTSIQGLRETFLKRDGLLRKVDKGWLLQVERKTLDVLLDSIPWGYSTFHLSWNEQIIFVEW